MESTATNRPTYSSRSATSRLVGLATLTCGGGGGAPCARGWSASQPARPDASSNNTAGRPRAPASFEIGMRVPADVYGASQQYGVVEPVELMSSRGRERA